MTNYDRWKLATPDYLEDDMNAEDTTPEPDEDDGSPLPSNDELMQSVVEIMTSGMPPKGREVHVAREHDAGPALNAPTWTATRPRCTSALPSSRLSSTPPTWQGSSTARARRSERNDRGRHFEAAATDPTD
jgi:hypothetical protein